MEIYQIRAFVTVARLAHLTRAAEALNLTQPAVSAQIKALEQSLGVSLFERSAGRLSLSKAGTRLLPTAELLLSQARQLKFEAKQLQGELSGEVLLGLPSEHLDFLRLGPLVNRITQSLPLIELQTQIMPAIQLGEYVSTSRLTAAFSISAYPPRDVNWLRLRSISYRLVLPNALAEEVGLGGWAELAMLPWLDGALGSHSHLLLREIFEKRGLSPRIVMHSADQAHMDALVRAGAGCALLREEIALNGVKQGHFSIWGHVKAEASLGFITPLENVESPLTVALISMLKEIWHLDSTLNTQSS
ncbi:LysR family transcriptional regulator [Paenalcaligenes niemegkensis]|uniref:LysR family transcriptional regulator n=1 Tax=Paenalcaligenes niemegkensis TaxID=2895469 RepID=UPI001EE9247A|nr:LysR family transcriptional regulator [Paenalcaligenes niemegkensis]MCQ9615815.1 LysR family transcriptional regulator [Paenalcaligenes niemegkensis]